MKSIETIGSVKHISLEDVDAKKLQFLIIFVLFQMAEEEPIRPRKICRNFWKDFKYFCDTHLHRRVGRTKFWEN